MAEYRDLNDFELNEILCDMKEIACEAGKKILEYYSDGKYTVEHKSDSSPVTDADKAADAMIRSKLSEKYPEFDILSEESVDDKKRLENSFCFIVDPLDGTANFVAGNGEFAVNVALCRDGEIIAGVIYIPATDEMYYAALGLGAYKQKKKTIKLIKVSKRKRRLRFLRSVFNMKPGEDKIISEHSAVIAKVIPLGASLKGCRIAEGKAEICYHYGATMEWDTAASKIIVEEAGGLFIRADGEEMKYNRDDVKNSTGFIIANRKENIFD